MRRFDDYFLMSRLLRRARFLLPSLVLMAFISFSNTTSSVFAQSTAEVCRETQKVRDQYAREKKAVSNKLEISHDLNHYNDTLSNLGEAIRVGYVVSGFYNLVYKLNSHADAQISKPRNVKERLDIQRQMYPLLKRLIDEASEVDDDQELIDQLDRINTQIYQRDVRLDELNCYEVLKRNSSDDLGGTPNLAGTWKALSWVYEITQNGTSFSWRITNDAVYNESATGEILDGNKIKATWTNKNGTDSGTATITVDSNGRATRMVFSNGVVFTRN